MRLNGEQFDIEVMETAADNILSRLQRSDIEPPASENITERETIQSNAQRGMEYTYQNRMLMTGPDFNLGANANEFFYSLGDCINPPSHDHLKNMDLREAIRQNPGEVFRQTAEELMNVDFYELGSLSDLELSQNVNIVRRLQSMRNIDQIAQEYADATGYQADPELIRNIKNTYDQNARTIEGAAAKVEYLSSSIYPALGTDPQFLSSLPESGLFSETNPAEAELLDSATAYAEGSLKIQSQMADTRMANNPQPAAPEHRLVIDITGKNYEIHGGAMSARLKLGFSTPGGEMTTGYFTQNTTYDPQTRYAEGIQNLVEKYPQFRDFTADLLNFEGVGFGLSGLKGLPLVDATETEINRFLDPSSKEYDRSVETDVWRRVIRDNYVEQQTFEAMQAMEGFSQFSYELMRAAIPNAELANLYGRNGIMRGDTANQRNNAMSEVAELLGQPDLLAKSVNMSILNGAQQIDGTFMYNANGTDLVNADPVNNPELAGREVEVSPEALSQISDMTIVDHICGNIDRHMGNLMYQFDYSQPGKAIVKGVQGIDNDYSFTTNADGRKQMSKLEDINFMNKNMAEAVMKMRPEQLETVMRRAGINPVEMEAAQGRLQRLQQKIAEGSIQQVEPNFWKNMTPGDLIHGVGSSSDTFGQVNDIVTEWNKFRRFESPNEKPQRPIEAAVNETGNAKFHLEAQVRELSAIRNTLMENDPRLHVNRTTYRNMFNALDKVIDMSSRMARQGGEPTDMQYNLLSDYYKELGSAAQNYVDAHPGTRSTEYGRLRVEMAKNLQVMAGDNRRAAQEDTFKNFSENVKAQEDFLRRNGAPEAEPVQSGADPAAQPQAAAGPLQMGRTVYGGLTVTESQKAEIQTQGNSLYLEFEPKPDGTYNMRQAFPKEGIVNGKTYQIRECMNIISKAYAQMLLNRDGSINIEKIKGTPEMGIGNLDSSVDWMEELNIPSESRAQITEFCEEFGANVESYLTGYSTYNGSKFEEFSQMSKVAAAETDPQIKAEMGRLLSESYPDYANQVNSIRELANIDPATESRILLNQDCGTSRGFNKGIKNAVNAKAKAEGKTEVTLTEEGLKFESTEIPAKGQINAFGAHALFGGSITIDGQERYLSLETTAPPSGRIVFDPEIGATGIGVFSSMAEMEAFHQWNNNIKFENIDTLKAFERLKTYEHVESGGANYSDYTLLQSKAYAKTTKHTIEELTERFNDPQTNAGGGKRTSENFEALNDAVKQYAETRDLADLQNVRSTAQKYLEGKISPHSNKRVNSFSEYTQNRINAAQDALEFASANLASENLKANLEQTAKQAHSELSELVKNGINTEADIISARGNLASMVACKQLSAQIDKMVEGGAVSSANVDLFTNPEMISNLSNEILQNPGFQTAIKKMGPEGLNNIVTQGNSSNSPALDAFNSSFNAESRKLVEQASMQKVQAAEGPNQLANGRPGAEPLQEAGRPGAEPLQPGKPVEGPANAPVQAHVI